LPILLSAQALLENVGYMHKTRLSTWVGTSLLASSLLLLPVATTVAQTTTPPPETRPPETRLVDTRDDHGKTGLWDLLGLTGLLGLAGLRRRPETVRTSTDPRAQSQV
jgi:MYXO-CTERM domain-containing protein